MVGLGFEITILWRGDRIDYPRRLRAGVMSIPDAPLLIGSRHLAMAEEAAAEIGGAEGVVLDSAADDHALGERPVSAVAVLFTDERIAELCFAHSRGVPQVSISPGLHEIGPEQIGGTVLKLEVL